MNVYLYKTNAPHNKIDKTSNLSNKHEYANVRFVEKGSFDILNPSVLLEYTDDLKDIKRFNYMSIPHIGRYYFIDKITTEGGLIRIDGRCDVLMTHRKDILSSKQFILRQQNKRSAYLPDSFLPIRNDHQYIMKKFGNPVDNKQCANILLITTGKGGTVVNPS